LDNFGITWLNGYGATGALDALGIRAFPTTIVVGKDGRVVWNDEMGGSLESALEQALAGAA
jgi:hypothetical protein